MAVTTISGDAATDLVNQSERVIDMADRIAELEPNNAPFVAILRRIGKVKAKSPKVEWLEAQSMPRFDTLSASATSAATTLGATNSSRFRVGDGVRVTETGEFIQITGVSASAIGANRGIGGTAAASATSAAGLYIVNNANAEGATLRSIKTVKLDNQYNYCQIIREPIGVTGTMLWSDIYGQYANERVRLQHQHGMEHERQIEATAFWGARKEDLTTSGSPLRFAGGLFEFISTNKTNVGGQLTRSSWETFLRTGFRYGSDRKAFFCSPRISAAIDSFAWGGSGSLVTTSSNSPSSQNVVNYNSPASEFGVNVKTYTCSQGVVDIIMKRHWHDSADLTGDGFLVDMDHVKMAVGRDTKLLLERQANDADKVEDEYLTEVSFLIENEQTHALMTGVTAP